MRRCGLQAIEVARGCWRVKRPRRFGRIAALCLLVAIAVSNPLVADEAAVLTVVEANQPTPIKLSLDAIKAMGRTEISTATPWTDGVQHFTGITGAEFVKSLKVTGGAVTAIAANDYQVTIPWDVLASDSTLIAYERNGEPMSVRDKGPLWIVFPFDSDAKYLTATYKSYSIWSLTSVEFR